jgi:hypothetical protein
MLDGETTPLPLPPLTLSDGGKGQSERYFSAAQASWMRVQAFLRISSEVA